MKNEKKLTDKYRSLHAKFYQARNKKIDNDNDNDNECKHVKKSLNHQIARSPNGVALKESHTRSILKGISWRIIATLTTISIAYLITGKLDFALEIGGIEVVAKIVFYYFHERLWQLNHLAISNKKLKRIFSDRKTLNIGHLKTRTKSPNTLS